MNAPAPLRARRRQTSRRRQFRSSGLGGRRRHQADRLPRTANLRPESTQPFDPRVANAPGTFCSTSTSSQDGRVERLAGTQGPDRLHRYPPRRRQSCSPGDPWRLGSPRLASGSEPCVTCTWLWCRGSARRYDPRNPAGTAGRLLPGGSTGPFGPRSSLELRQGSQGGFDRRSSRRSPLVKRRPCVGVDNASVG